MSDFDVVLTVHRRYYVEMKCKLDSTDEFLLQILVLAHLLHLVGFLFPHKMSEVCEISSFLYGVVWACALLGYYAAWAGFWVFLGFDS
jgi:hypothetical protein